MDHLETAFVIPSSPDLLAFRNGSFPWIGRVKYPILVCPSCPAFFPAKFASIVAANGRKLGGKLATGIQLRGEPPARHRSEAATNVARRSARGHLLHRRRGLRLV